MSIVTFSDKLQIEGNGLEGSFFAGKFYYLSHENTFNTPLIYRCDIPQIAGEYTNIRL